MPETDPETPDTVKTLQATTSGKVAAASVVASWILNTVGLMGLPVALYAGIAAASLAVLIGFVGIITNRRCFLSPIAFGIGLCVVAGAVAILYMGIENFNILDDVFGEPTSSF